MIQHRLKWPSKEKALGITNKWPIIKADVDWKWVFINSVNFEWNGGMKIDPKYHRTFFLEISALMVLNTTLRDLGMLFEDILNIILEKDEKKANKAITLLTAIKKKSEDDISQVIKNALSDEDSIEVNEEFHDAHKNSATICEHSKFSEHYWKILVQKTNSINNNEDAEITNRYYVPNFAGYFLKTFLSYACSTTGLIMPNTSRSKILSMIGHCVDTEDEEKKNLQILNRIEDEESVPETTGIYGEFQCKLCWHQNTG